jgi:hypothetical protein
MEQEKRRAIRINGATVALPHQLVIEPQTWKQYRLAPMDRPGKICLDPESFDLEVAVDGPVAVYGSVVDHQSADGRMVAAVDLELN